MSFETQPVFVHKGNDWDDTTRTHPALAWIENYARGYDSTGPVFDGWFTDDFVYQKSDGSEHQGRDGFEEMKRNRNVFTGRHHVPRSFYCIETEYGYEFLTQAQTYLNLPGEPAPGEKKAINSNTGDSWDVLVSAIFRFEIRSVGSDFRIQRADAYADTAPAVAKMMARGVKLA